MRHCSIHSRDYLTVCGECDPPTTAEMMHTFPTTRCPKCGNESFVANSCGCDEQTLLRIAISNVLDRGPKGRERWHFYEDGETSKTAADDDRLDFCIDVAQRYRTLRAK
jgi:hypothetical protein